MRKNIPGKILTNVLLIIYSLICIYPVAFLLLNSIREKLDYIRSPLGFPQTFTLQNIISVITKDRFLVYFGNSLLLTIVSTVSAIIIACLASFAFARFKFKGKQGIFNMIISLMAIPPILCVTPLFVLFVKIGLINNYFAVILIYVAFILPFSILFITNFFRTIPEEMIEAASIDGCSDMRILFKIFLPLSKAPVMTMLVVNALWVWNELLIAMLFLQSDKKKTLMVSIANLYSKASLNPTIIFASLAISTIPILILYIFTQKYFVRGITAGTIK